MSRLSIDMTDQQHQSLKALAALQGKSIRQYAIERLFPAAADDDAAWRDLKTLLERRVSDALAGRLSAKSVDEVVDEEFGAVSRP